MITVENIIEWSKPHPVINGKITRISNKNIEFSIVGGARGLYGDFVNDFEMAIFDKESKQFITKFFYPEATDDVIPYMPKEEMVKLINKVIRSNDFQVR
jgi:hypothetical protein